MEMVGMDAELKSFSSEDFSIPISKWVDQILFDTDEFKTILKKTDLSAEEKNVILKSIESSDVKCILKINLISQIYNGVTNATVVSTGLQTLIQSQGLEDALEKGLGLYLVKLLISPVVAYIGWWKKKIHKKYQLSASLLIPGIGDWAFLMLSLRINHSQFLKFLITYQKIKRKFRKAVEKNSPAEWGIFEKQLGVVIDEMKSVPTFSRILNLYFKTPIRKILHSTSTEISKKTLDIPPEIAVSELIDKIKN